MQGRGRRLIEAVAEKATIPEELKGRNQWVLWKLETVNGKETKIPYQINGQKATSTDSTTWTSYDEALEVYKSTNKYNGIGYVLIHDDPYIVIDLDNCIKNEKATPEASTIVRALNSYTEYSQSGKGLHIIVKANKPGDRSKNPDKGIEIYDKKRFIVMTGDRVKGTPPDIRERQSEITKIYNHYFPDKKPPQNKPVTVSEEMTDQDILSIAFKAKNGDKIQSLYMGNWGGYGSHSEADQALCNYLAFYTQDPEQIDRIFTGSGLYRDKWDRKDYKTKTIDNAIEGLKATYQKQGDFQLHVKDNATIDLKKELKDRYFKELALMQAEWKENGGKGRKPTTISPARCAVILPEYISFILFDLEENTRLAMYLPKEGIYTRNLTLIKRVISWLEPKLNNAKADEVIYHLTNKAEVKEKTESRYLIPVENGVFNLKTKTLEPFSPDYVFTTKISTSYTDNPICPVIDGWDINSWMNSIACGDSEIVNLLWQVINDSLNGNYSRKKAIFLVGDGNNGKGTFQQLITNLIGMKNIATLKVNEFDERFKLSILEGKTAVIGDDVPANVYIDDSSNFNSVATGDVVSVEFKNKPIYNTVFRCSVIQSTNGMPKFKNKTNGTTRRIVIVPFKADFNGKVENFKIKDEYIQNEKVLQYVLYKAINMDFEKFDIPEASKRELEIFKQDNDPVYDFKLSVFDEWKIPKVPKYIVYGFYKNFCEENGYKPLSDRQFHKQFKSYLGKEWNPDAQGKFRYDSIINYIGDLDRMGLGFGFPDQKVNHKAYENTRLQVV